MKRLLAAALMLAATSVVTVVTAPSAQAAAAVSVRNDRGGSQADSTYRTALTVSGGGFQAVKGGFGGVYVAFGWVNDRAGGSWKPSRGGVTGRDYRYIPDAEDVAANQGYLKFVAFPGSPTAGEASAVMLAAGRFSVELTVPGPVFESVDRDGDVSRVDCREVTCGVITIGAHGVKNASNETFTPVAFGTVYDDAPAASTPSAPAAASPAPATDDRVTAETAADDTVTDASAQAPMARAPADAPVAAGAPALLTDRATAVAGRALAFTGQGFTPGEQVLAILDDGVAAHGPMVAGSAGEVAGLLRLPLDLSVGTHELRLTAAASGAEVSELFPVQSDAAVPTRPVAQESGDPRQTASRLFAAAAALAFLLALGAAVWRRRTRVAA